MKDVPALVCRSLPLQPGRPAVRGHCRTVAAVWHSPRRLGRQRPPPVIELLPCEQASTYGSAPHLHRLRNVKRQHQRSNTSAGATWESLHAMRAVSTYGSTPQLHILRNLNRQHLSSDMSAPAICARASTMRARVDKVQHQAYTDHVN